MSRTNLADESPSRDRVGDGFGGHDQDDGALAEHRQVEPVRLEEWEGEAYEHRDALRLPERVEQCLRPRSPPTDPEGMRRPAERHRFQSTPPHGFRGHGIPRR